MCILSGSHQPTRQLPSWWSLWLRRVRRVIDFLSTMAAIFLTLRQQLTSLRKSIVCCFMAQSRKLLPPRVNGRLSPLNGFVCCRRVGFRLFTNSKPLQECVSGILQECQVWPMSCQSPSLSSTREHPDPTRFYIFLSNTDCGESGNRHSNP